MAAIAGKKQSITTFCVKVTNIFSTSEQLLGAAAKVLAGWGSKPEQKFKEIFMEAEQMADELEESTRPP